MIDSRNLVAKYDLNGNGHDSSPNAINATKLNASPATDRFGNESRCYSFDGKSSYVQIAPSELFNFSYTEDFTISFWVLVLENANSGDIISKWNTRNNTGYPFAIRYLGQDVKNSLYKNRIAFLRYDSEECENLPVVLTKPMVINEWTHITARKKGSKLSIFVNGRLNGKTKDTTEGICGTENEAPLIFGKRGENQRYFNGKIDDVSIFNLALTQRDINIISSFE
ncbi:MAG: LamG domain-containing protein [Fulvivirga sp.]|uniref:LamG domain-containing protein n=1 Tax=Fulvivirga sp. TaxID=1931237 RepID=UPI0032F03E78